MNYCKDLTFDGGVIEFVNQAKYFWSYVERWQEFWCGYTIHEIKLLSLF